MTAADQAAAAARALARAAEGTASAARHVRAAGDPDWDGPGAAGYREEVATALVTVRLLRWRLQDAEAAAAEHAAALRDREALAAAAGWPPGAPAWLTSPPLASLPFPSPPLASLPLPSPPSASPQFASPPFTPSASVPAPLAEPSAPLRAASAPGARAVPGAVADGGARGVGLVIRGGAGGTAATLEHLGHAATRLRVAAEMLDDAASSAGWAERHGLGPAPGAAVTLARARAALDLVLRGGRSLGAQADGLRALSAALVRAADALGRAEDAAASAVRLVLAVGGQHAGATPLPAVVVGTLLARGAVPGLLLGGAALHVTGRGRAAAAWLRSADPAEHAVQALAGFVRGMAPGAAPPSPAPAVGTSRLVTTGAVLAGIPVPSLARRPLRVTPRPSGAPPGPGGLAGSAVVPATAPRGAADVLARVGHLYPRSGGSAGTVAVDRVDHPDGRRAWVVAIPGTQAASFGASTNPMDMVTNVRLLAGWADDSSELVTRALRRAGARPGEPVLLAGHSQGGMVAVALARSAQFAGRYRVAAVLTAGSPVATLPVPAGTAALHLEHRQDLVPALDGHPNPDRPHRTTVVRDLAASPVGADRLAARSLGEAHGVAAYVRTARVTAAAGGPSVRAWERATAAVLGGAGATVVRREFTGTRAPVGVGAGAGAPTQVGVGAGPAGRLSGARGSPR